MTAIEIVPQYFLAQCKHRQTETHTDHVQRKHNCSLTPFRLHFVVEFPSMLHPKPWEGVAHYKNWLKTAKSVSAGRIWVSTGTWLEGQPGNGFGDSFFRRAVALKTIILLHLSFIWTHYSIIFQYGCLALTEKFVSKCSVHRRYFHCLCRPEIMLADGLSDMSKEVKQENVLLCPVGAAAAPEQELLCIFGTGDFGRSLGQRMLQTGYRVVYGSRRPHSCGHLPQGAQVKYVTRCHLKLWDSTCFPGVFFLLMFCFFLPSPPRVCLSESLFACLDL